MKYHERTHIQEKPFSCSKCDKKYLRESEVKVHERTHTKEKPFGCPTCHKIFISSSDLCRHKTTHTNERPFKCKLCNKTFTRKCHLKRHEKNFHNVPIQNLRAKDYVFQMSSNHPSEDIKDEELSRLSTEIEIKEEFHEFNILLKEDQSLFVQQTVIQ